MEPVNGRDIPGQGNITQRVHCIPRLFPQSGRILDQILQANTHVVGTLRRKSTPSVALSLLQCDYHYGIGSHVRSMTDGDVNGEFLIPSRLLS